MVSHKNIFKLHGNWRIRSATTGLLLKEKFKTLGEAIKRRRQIYVFKHHVYK